MLKYFCLRFSIEETKLPSFQMPSDVIGGLLAVDLSRLKWADPESDPTLRRAEYATVSLGNFTQSMAILLGLWILRFAPISRATSELIRNRDQFFEAFVRHCY